MSRFLYVHAPSVAMWVMALMVVGAGLAASEVIAAGVPELYHAFRGVAALGAILGLLEALEVAVFERRYG